MRLLRSAVIAVCICIPSAGHGEGTAEALKAFGSVGTWAQDCAKEERTTINFPWFGVPTTTSIVIDEGKKVVVESRIEFAERITEEKLKSISVQTGRKLSIQEKYRWLPQPGERWSAVEQKVGNKIQVILQEREDGKKIIIKDGFLLRPQNIEEEIPTQYVNLGKYPPAEKCLN